MARRQTRVYIDDWASLRRFIQRAPKVFNEVVRQAVKDTATGPVESKMRAYARVGPDAPHIKTDIETRVARRSAQVGYLREQSAGGTDPQATQPDVALFQNYGTKRAKGNGFMWRAADDSANDYRTRMIKALREAERKLAI